MKQDKSLPQAVDLEEVVLGAILIASDAMIQVADFLKPEMFYNGKFAEVYRCCVRMFEKGERIDIITVTTKLKATSFHGGGTTLEYVGGAYFITKLLDRVANSANIEIHARIIAQKYIERELINISGLLQTKVYEGRTDTFLLESYVSDMQMLFSGVTGNKSEKTMQRLTDESVDAYRLRKLNAQKGIVPGVPSGTEVFDKQTGGFQDSDLIILAGRPAMGKTAWALQIGKYVAESGKAVGIFSLEMSSIQLVNRLLITESQAPTKGFKSGNLLDHEEQAVVDAAKKLQNIPLLIDDTAAITTTQLRAKAKRWKAQHNISLLVVDYLQLMTANTKGNRDTQIGEITRTLKVIAKELNIPVIALSQLSRQVEGRGGDKRPTLTDLRESGNIEQDADMVIFIHRPEYYGFEKDDEGNSTKGKAEFIIAKFRSGSPGTVDVGFIDYLTKFYDPNNAVASAATLAGITPNEDFLNKEPF